MPGMQKWGEISSCSNCTDFQAGVKLGIPSVGGHQAVVLRTGKKQDKSETDRYGFGKCGFQTQSSVNFLASPSSGERAQ